MVTQSDDREALDDWADARLLAVDEGPPAEGSVIDRRPGCVGVRVPVGMARLLDGSMVWVHAMTTAGQVLLMRAIADRASDIRDVLYLRDLVHLATETRRRHLRSAAEQAVLLVQHGTRARRTVTRDLSADGCRVEQPPEHALAPGQRLQTAISLDAGPVLWAETEVKRVDQINGEIALQFLGIDGADRARLDRHVLARLTLDGV